MEQVNQKQLAMCCVEHWQYKISSLAVLSILCDPMLLEETFPMCDVRYIAITDNIDTIHGVDDSVAVRDLFNEWHARDTSKKIKAVIMASAKRGERIGTKAPYGYKKHPDAPKQTVPNEDTAPTVQRIFSLCASGFGPDQIARILKDEQVLTPTVYDFAPTELDTDI